MTILPRSFYARPDVVRIARDLIGQVLVTRFNGVRTTGLIIETEAYAGVGDRASHAFGGRRTARTEVMYRRAGTAYVYLCYGIHHLFNVVTYRAGVPHAVLIRGIRPLEGTDVMAERRGVPRPTTTGPGTAAQALGIRTIHSGMDLLSDELHIEEGPGAPPAAIRTGPRIGVDYAGDDALLPYRHLLISTP